MPVAAACWDAWLTSALLTGATEKIKMLVAARPGYINPVLLAKMIATFDQMTKGRISINLIAGQNDVENVAEGVGLSKNERYEMMMEEVEICKGLWSGNGKLDYDGKYYNCKAHIGQSLSKAISKILSWWRIPGFARFSAKHAHVHLFWGDTVERIKSNISQIRKLARKYKREREIGFGMRLQIICRETEAEAWTVAEGLIKNVTDDQKIYKNTFRRFRSESARSTVISRIWRNVRTKFVDEATKARPGAGIVIVGEPEQCAETLQSYIDMGATFCLSGYLHDEEAIRFGGG